MWVIDIMIFWGNTVVECLSLESPAKPKSKRPTPESQNVPVQSTEKLGGLDPMSTPNLKPFKCHLSIVM